MAKSPPPSLIVGAQGGTPFEYKVYGLWTELFVPLWQCFVTGTATGGFVSGLLTTAATIIDVVWKDAIWWISWWNHFVNWSHIVWILVSGISISTFVILRFGQEVISPYFDTGWITRWVDKSRKVKPDRQDELWELLYVYVASRLASESQLTKRAK